MLLQFNALMIALSAGGRQQQPEGEVQIDCILLYLTTKHVFVSGCGVYRCRSSVGHFHLYL